MSTCTLKDIQYMKILQKLCISLLGNDRWLINPLLYCISSVGLSPDLQSMEQIRRIMRPTDVPETGKISQRASFWILDVPGLLQITHFRKLRYCMLFNYVPYSLSLSLCAKNHTSHCDFWWVVMLRLHSHGLENRLNDHLWEKLFQLFRGLLIIILAGCILYSMPHLHRKVWSLSNSYSSPLRSKEHTTDKWWGS